MTNAAAPSICARLRHRCSGQDAVFWPESGNLRQTRHELSHSREPRRSSGEWWSPLQLAYLLPGSGDRKIIPKNGKSCGAQNDHFKEDLLCSVNEGSLKVTDGHGRYMITPISASCSRNEIKREHDLARSSLSACYPQDLDTTG